MSSAKRHDDWERESQKHFPHIHTSWRASIAGPLESHCVWENFKVIHAENNLGKMNSGRFSEARVVFWLTEHPWNGQALPSLSRHINEHSISLIHLLTHPFTKSLPRTHLSRCPDTVHAVYKWKTSHLGLLTYRRYFASFKHNQMLPNSEAVVGVAEDNNTDQRFPSCSASCTLGWSHLTAHRSFQKIPQRFILVVCVFLM